jgi:hypothetical protein
MVMPWEDTFEPVRRTERWKAILRKQPSAFLLLVQVGVIILLPWLETLSYGRVVLIVLSFIALTVAIITVRSTPALTWVSVLIGLPALVLEISSLFTDAVLVNGLAHASLAAFYFYTAYSLIAYMFEDSFVTKDELFAVGACFTVLLFAFAYAYLAIQEFYPLSFTSFAGEGQRTFLELIYYSGANFTGCGLSDIIAIKSQARAITTLEQLAGVLYVAMVISRLVALTVMRNRN